MKRLLLTIIAGSAVAADAPITVKPITFTPAGARIEFATTTNRVYAIQESNDCRTWATVTTNMPGTGTNIVRFMPLATRRFYRVKSQ